MMVAGMRLVVHAIRWRRQMMLVAQMVFHRQIMLFVGNVRRCVLVVVVVLLVAGRRWLVLLLLQLLLVQLLLQDLLLQVMVVQRVEVHIVVVVEVAVQIGVERGVQLALHLLYCLQLLHLLKRRRMEQSVVVGQMRRLVGQDGGGGVATVGDVALFVGRLHVFVGSTAVLVVVVFGLVAFAFDDDGRLHGRRVGQVECLTVYQMYCVSYSIVTII